SIDVLSELAAVPPGDATVEQRPEGRGHARRRLLHGGPHLLRGAEVRRVARVEEVGMERRAPELALFLERVAHVVRERLDVDRWDALYPLRHGYLLYFRFPPRFLGCARAVASHRRPARLTASHMPAILSPKRPDASRRTSTVIEASTSVPEARPGV